MNFGLIDPSALHTGPLERLAPVIILCLGVVVLITADILLRRATMPGKGLGLGLALAVSAWTAVLSTASCVFLWLDGDTATQLFLSSGPLDAQLGTEGWAGAAISSDHFALLASALVSVCLFVTVLTLGPYLRQRRLYRPELFPLLLMSAAGMALLGFSRDLLLTFAAIELLSLPLYVLCGLNLRDILARESSLKYFLLGAFASGFFIYGAGLIYGAAGHLNYSAIVHALGQPSGPGSLALAGIALVAVGLGFKIALVPFHAWVPDVYQGAPTPITGFMATGVKVAAAAAFIRLLVEIAHSLPPKYWQHPLVLLAGLSMLGGNLLALHQMSLKRLLACSAIAHTGYLAVGIAAGTFDASASLLFYLATYVLAALGCFMLVAQLAPEGQDDIFLDQLNQLYARAPGRSAVLTILLLSLGGFPLTAGFIGKLLVFRDAWNAGLVGLVIFALLNSVVSFYYYLRVVLAMYMQPEAPGGIHLLPAKLPRMVAVPLGAILLLTLWLGILPGGLLDVSESARLGSSQTESRPPTAPAIHRELPPPGR
jgi:NADH-quinone oxidoreductase subunit N